MNYQVLSRKYRPQNFNEVVGQKHVVDTILNSIDLNRIAHGYLLTGLRGVGKTTIARVFAKTLNCTDLKSNITCENCQNCIEIRESRSLDVIELDGASNRGIDEIREIKETVKYPPVSSKYKIFIIDEVHMLTKEAFNALLKTLEEPPTNVIFILATTNPFKIPDTILSRTLRFDFKKFTKYDISNHLEKLLVNEKIKFEDKAINLISIKADGSMRDALSILDKIISYSNEEITLETVIDSLGIIEESVYLDILKLIYAKDVDKLLNFVDKILESGYDLNNFTSGFNVFLSNSLIYISGYKKEENLSEQSKDWFKDNEKKLSSIDLTRIIDELHKFELNSKFLVHSEIAFETLLVKLAMMDSTVEIQTLIEGLDLENNNNLDNKALSNNSKKQVVSKKKITKENIIDNKNNEKVYNEKFSSSENLVEQKKENLQNKKKVKNIEDNWNTILLNIEKKDKRIYALLEKCEILSNHDFLTIDLKSEGNDFIKKTLTDKINLIKECIYGEIKKEFEIEIIYQKQVDVDDEKKHPLYDKIKNKFN
tara:strand:- start:8043 stop:9662 length:1620 start_codon:yes stop_codon:yes gene_type:complete